MKNCSGFLALTTLALFAGSSAADEAQAVAAAERHVAAPRGRDRRRTARAAGAAERRDERGGHPRERGRCSCHAGEARHPARILETPGAPVSVYGELRDARCDAHAAFLCALRRPAGRPGGRLEDAAVRADAARGSCRGRRAGRFPGPTASSRCRTRRASTRARRATTRRRSSRCSPPSMRCDAANIPLSANLKFFLEGEEEAGSPNLARTLAAHRDCFGPISGSSATGRSTRAGCRASRSARAA